MSGDAGRSRAAGQWVEIEVEYVRREKKRVRIDVFGGPSETDAVTWEIGRFSRSLNFHVHDGKSLAAGETPRLLSWRLVPGPSCRFVIVESTPGDEESGTICLRPEGHDGGHSPFSNIGGERISASSADASSQTAPSGDPATSS